MSITFSSFVILTALLFGAGLFAVLTRSNIVAMLMGIELLLNASALNVVAFSQMHGTPIEGQLVAMFIIVIAACEAAIAFGLLMNFYRTAKSVDVDHADKLRDR